MSGGEPRPGFRWWAASSALSTLGDSVTFFAVAWVAASHGAAASTLVVTANVVPLCIFVVLGGAVTDRWGPRQVLIVADAAMAGAMTLFAVTAHLAEVSVWALAAISFVSGSGAGLRRPAAGSFPRLFATNDQLGRMMASVTLLTQIALVTGPLVAGTMVHLGGLALTASYDAASFAVVTLVTLTIRPPLDIASHSGARRWWSELREGCRSARAQRGVVATLVATSGLAVTVLPLLELCVPLAGHARAWGIVGTGVVSASWSVGGMAVMATVARQGTPRSWIARTGPLAAASGALVLAATDDLASAVVALLLIGSGTSMTTARLVPRFLNTTPPDMIGRYQSLLHLAQVLPVLLVTPILGATARSFGIETALVGTALVLLAVVVPVRQAERAEPD